MANIYEREAIIKKHFTKLSSEQIVSITNFLKTGNITHPFRFLLEETMHEYANSVLDAKIQEIRQVVADYMKSEGCACCRNGDEHKAAANKLGHLLGVKKYPDGSGYDFFSCSSKEQQKVQNNT